VNVTISEFVEGPEHVVPSLLRFRLVDSVGLKITNRFSCFGTERLYFPLRSGLEKPLVVPREWERRIVGIPLTAGVMDGETARQVIQRGS
jgi:hypothetical protein